MSAGAVLDPRDRVTPTAFEIAPDVMGRTLASPTRRAVALGVDLLLAGVISAIGGAAVVGMVAAGLFFAVAMRSGRRGRVRRVVRGALASVGALILFGVGVAVVDGDGGDYGSDPPDTAALLADIERDLRDDGIEVDLSGAAAPRSAPDSLDPAVAARDLRAFAAALAAADSLALDSLADRAALAAAGPELRRRADRIEALGNRAERLADERDRLQATLDDPSVLRAARSWAADFGLTLGWIGVYFTLTLAWLGGRTPGKRLAGIRVVRLDGRPLSLWNAFERFGGYAAGLVTGLLGFAQILWDPNRQGVQDKIAGTVVVRVADAEPPPRAG